MATKKSKKTSATQAKSVKKKKADPNVKAPEVLLDADDIGFPTSLNDELVEKIKKNPNGLIGCGG